MGGRCYSTRAGRVPRRNTRPWPPPCRPAWIRLFLSPWRRGRSRRPRCLPPRRRRTAAYGTPSGGAAAPAPRPLARRWALVGGDPPRGPWPVAQLAEGGLLLLAGPLPAAAVPALARLATTPGARVVLAGGDGWAPQALAAALLLLADASRDPVPPGFAPAPPLLAAAENPEALLAAARVLAPRPRPLPAPRLGEMVPLGSGWAAAASPEAGLGLLLPRHGACGAPAAAGLPLRPGRAMLRVPRPVGEGLRLLLQRGHGRRWEVTVSASEADAQALLAAGGDNRPLPPRRRGPIDLLFTIGAQTGSEHG